MIMGLLRVRDTKTTDVNKQEITEALSPNSVVEFNVRRPIVHSVPTRNITVPKKTLVYAESRAQSTASWSKSWRLVIATALSANDLRPTANRHYSSSSEQNAKNICFIPTNKKTRYDSSFLRAGIGTSPNNIVSNSVKNKSVRRTGKPPIAVTASSSSPSTAKVDMNSATVFDSGSGIMETRRGSGNLLSAAEAIDAASAALSPSRRGGEASYFASDIHSPLSVHSSASSDRSNSQWDSKENDVISDFSDNDEYCEQDKIEMTTERIPAPTGNDHVHRLTRSKKARVENIVTNMKQQPESVQFAGNALSLNLDTDQRDVSKTAERSDSDNQMKGDEKFPLTRKRKMQDLKEKIEMLHSEYKHLQANQEDDQMEEEEINQGGEEEEEIEVGEPEDENRDKISIDSSNSDAMQLADIVAADASSPGQFIDHALDFIKKGESSDRMQEDNWNNQDAASFKSENLVPPAKRMKPDSPRDACARQNSGEDDYHSCFVSQSRGASSIGSTGNSSFHPSTRCRVSDRRIYKSPTRKTSHISRLNISHHQQQALARTMLSSSLSTEEMLFVEAFKREMTNAVENAADSSAVRVLSALRASGVFLGSGSDVRRQHGTTTSHHYVEDENLVSPARDRFQRTEESSREGERSVDKAEKKPVSRQSSFDISQERKAGPPTSFVIQGETEKLRTASQSQMCFGDVEVNPRASSASTIGMMRSSSAQRYVNFASIYNKTSAPTSPIAGSYRLLRSPNAKMEQTQALSLVTGRKSSSTRSHSDGDRKKSSPVRDIPIPSPLFPNSSAHPTSSTVSNPFVQYPFTSSKHGFPSPFAAPLAPFGIPSTGYPGSIIPNAHHHLTNFLPGLAGPFGITSRQDGRRREGFPTNSIQPLVSDLSSFSRAVPTVSLKMTENYDLENRGCMRKKEEVKTPPRFDGANFYASLAAAAKLAEKQSPPSFRRGSSCSPTSSTSPTAGTLAVDRSFLPGGNESAFRHHMSSQLPASSSATIPNSYLKPDSYDKSAYGRLAHRRNSSDLPHSSNNLRPGPGPVNPLFPYHFPILPGFPQSSHITNVLANYEYLRMKKDRGDFSDTSPKLPSSRVKNSLRRCIQDPSKHSAPIGNGCSLSIEDSLDYMGGSRYSFPNNLQEGLTPEHLKKAKLIFFYSRYPNANTLKSYFPDVKFNRALTSQLIKWFSNFREFFYIQMEKSARQAVSDGLSDPAVLRVTRDSEIFRVLNIHYNKCNEFHVPDHFVQTAEASLREFFIAVKAGKDCDSGWKKVIYKVINKMDVDIPEVFKSPNVFNRLHEIAD